MKKTMFVTAMLIAVLVTMLAANFALAAGPTYVAAGTIAINSHREDAFRESISSMSAGYVPWYSLTSSSAGPTLYDKVDRFDPFIN